MFIQRALRRYIAKDCFSFHRTFTSYEFNALALNQDATTAKLEENISRKVNARQFKALREDIFNSTDAASYQNTEILRTIILKSIRKKNSAFAYDILEEMIKLDIVPDDATYTTLMDALLHEGRVQDSFGLYIHAYLNNVVLDLQIFRQLVQRLQKKDISYVQVAYEILKDRLVPTKPLFDTLINIAQKAKVPGFLTMLYEDMNKYGIQKTDNSQSQQSSHRELSSYPHKDKFNMMMPFDPSESGGVNRRVDSTLNNLISEFIHSFNNGRRDSKALPNDYVSSAEEGETEDSEVEVEEETETDSDSDNTPRRSR